MSQRLLRDVATHVGFEIEHCGDRGAEVIGFVPRQPARHPHQLIDGDGGAIVGPLGPQLGVRHRDFALLHEPPDKQVRHTLGHRPAQLRCAGSESVPVALTHQGSVFEHDDPTGAQRLLLRRIQVIAKGGRQRRRDGRFGGWRGGGRHRVLRRGHRRQRPVCRERGSQRAARLVVVVGGLTCKEPEDRRRHRAPVRRRVRLEVGHERVRRQVARGIICATGDRGDSARVVGGIPGRGEQQGLGVQISPGERDEDKDQEAEQDSAKESTPTALLS